MIKRRNQDKDILTILIFRKCIIKFRKENDNNINRQKQERKC